MKRYLARLAARAQAPVVSPPVPASPVDDPFSATAESRSNLSDPPTADAIVRPSGLPPSLDRRDAGTRPSETAPVFSAESDSLQPSATAPKRPFSSDASAENRSDPHLPFRPRSERSSRHVDPTESSANASTDLTPLVQSKTPPRPSSTPDDCPAFDNARTLPREEQALPLLPPREADLLKVADRFMQGLHETAAALSGIEENSAPTPPLLPSREAAGAVLRHSPSAPETEPAGTVHIGNLRVEIVAPPVTAPPPAPPRTTIIVQQGGGNSARRGASRSAFGLRQL